MPWKDIESKTSDSFILRGWFCQPPSHSAQLPCLIMAHGWSAVQEMDLDVFADYFTSKLPISCLVYDNRGFGTSDAAEGQPRHEAVPSLQMADYSDAFTYAQSLSEVDAGSTHSGSHVLYVGAADRRVKAVLAQGPLVQGFENFSRLVRSDIVPGMVQMWQDDRIARMQGKDPAHIPLVSNDPLLPSALPTPDSYEFFRAWAKKVSWKNEVTIRSVELPRANDPSHLIHRISPTPLLMTVAANDVLTPTNLALEAYSRAREPK